VSGDSVYETAGDHPMPGSSFRMFLRRDLATGAPKEVVAWRIWPGGFKELWTWPWDYDGLADAGRWGYSRRAEFGNSQLNSWHVIRDPDELLVHADAI
jgi:hypothetical protein